MSDFAIHRMNFLGQGRWAFTYKTMIQAVVVWCGILLLIYGIQILWQMRLISKVRDAKEVVSSMDTERDQLLKLIEQMTLRRSGLSAKKGFAAMVRNRPRWSEILENLKDNLSPQVWLDSIEVRTDEEGRYELDIAGKAKSQRALTNFIMRMESSGDFKGTILERSSFNAGVFEYKITTRPIMRTD